MSTKADDRLNLGCLVGALTARIVTQSGIVYQGTVLDWDCGGFPDGRTDDSTSDSASSKTEQVRGPRSGAGCCRSFIRLELACVPGNICCPNFTAPGAAPVAFPLTAARVVPITDFTDDVPLYGVGSVILINWDDIATVGIISTTDCLTD